MLKIYYGDLKSDKYIFNPDAFFNNTYDDEWIMEDLSIKMIKDIDGSTVIGPRVIDSPYLGSIPTERLSGGVKTLILMYKDQEHIFNASACGDNCAKWIIDIARRLEEDGKDLYIRLGYLMDFGNDSFAIEIANLKKIVRNKKELCETVLDNGLL